MLEKDIEAHLVARVKAKGGIAYKFTSPQRRSVPDRLVLLDISKAAKALKVVLQDYGVPTTAMTSSLHEGQAAAIVASMIQFAELKAPGKKPTPLQEREHARLRAMGFTVHVIDSKEGVDAVYPRG
jgi:hypothetical protein